MGQARARGSYEDRKSLAIIEGRVKRPLARWHFKNTTTPQGLVIRSRVTTKPGRVSQHFNEASYVI